MPQFRVSLQRMADLFWIRMLSLFALGGVLNQLQEDMEVVIVYANRSLQLSQRRYCTTLREMLAAVAMCTHFRSYLWGLSSLCVWITAHSGGCRSFGTVMACWPAGIYYWVSFQFHSSTGWGPSILTRTAYPVDRFGIRFHCCIPT